MLVSRHRPSRWGPSHCGQSSALTALGIKPANSTAKNNLAAIRQWGIVRLRVWIHADARKPLIRRGKSIFLWNAAFFFDEPAAVGIDFQACPGMQSLENRAAI